MITRQAVVLVGGKGTRLGALTAATPKPLMPLAGERVFLDVLLAEVARHGFDDILLLAGHLHEQFVARYDGRRIGGAAIGVVVEPEPAGTAGALRAAAGRLDEQFLFLNGDTLFDVNLRALDPILAADPRAAGVLALRRLPDAARYGAVDLREGRIAAFREKSTAAGECGLVNGGVGLLRRTILDAIVRLPLSIEAEVYPGLARRGLLLGHEAGGYFIDIGLPESLAQARRALPARRRPALFLDRDGVLVRDAGYTHRVEDLDWMPGAVETIRRANDIGALVVVVTNQSGVARGYYDEAAVAAFHAAMQRDLMRAGAHVDAFHACFLHPAARLPAYRHPDPPDRKPNPGMILKAIAAWDPDVPRSLLIGDKDSDVEAARRAGVAPLLFTGGDLRDAAMPALAAMAGWDRTTAPQNLR